MLKTDGGDQGAGVGSVPSTLPSMHRAKTSHLSNLFILGYAKSSLLLSEFLELRQVGTPLQLQWASFLSRGFLFLQSAALGLASSSCEAQAWLPCGMWGPLGPGIEPVAPESANRLPTPGPPERSFFSIFRCAVQLLLSIFTLLCNITQVSIVIQNIKECSKNVRKMKPRVPRRL